MPTKSYQLSVLSHGGAEDNEALNDLCNALGQNVHRIQMSGGKAIGRDEIRQGLTVDAFVIVGLCGDGMIPSSKIRVAERNILQIADSLGLPYGIFCRRISYGLSHHLLDTSNMRVILTCEMPDEEQAAMLRRAFPNAGDPISIRIPRTDAPKVRARIDEIFAPVA